MTDEFVRKNSPEFQQMLQDIKDIKVGILGSEYGSGGLRAEITKIKTIEIPRLHQSNKEICEEVQQLKRFRDRIIFYTSGAAMAGGGAMHLIIQFLK